MAANTGCATPPPGCCGSNSTTTDDDVGRREGVLGKNDDVGRREGVLGKNDDDEDGFGVADAMPCCSSKASNSSRIAIMSIAVYKTRGPGAR
jgi:hypothetical protein